MSTEDKIETLKDGLRPDIRKLLVLSEFDTVADLKQAAWKLRTWTKKRLITKRKFLRSANRERSLQGQEGKRPWT